jgi:hypothetical protein
VRLPKVVGRVPAAAADPVVEPRPHPLAGAPLRHEYGRDTPPFFLKKNLKMKISDSLGPEYGEACILDLEATWAESDPRTPLVCMLSIGSDPSPQIATLAKLKEISEFESLKPLFL